MVAGGVTFARAEAGTRDRVRLSLAASVAFYRDVAGLEHRFTDAWGMPKVVMGATVRSLTEQRRAGG